VLTTFLRAVTKAKKGECEAQAPCREICPVIYHLLLYFHSSQFISNVICMYVCMYVCMHACMLACMYLCMYVCMYCMHACMHACMYVCMLLGISKQLNVLQKIGLTSCYF